MSRFILFLSFSLTTTGFFCQAQPVGSIDSVLIRYGIISAYTSPEKVYLHTDKQLYCAGEYIWFNAYLENSSPTALQPESNFVYVELIKDNVLTRVMIKRTPEGFPGRIPLSAELSSGNYLLRAYTSWMNNFPLEYMFHKEITVINPTDEDIIKQPESLPPDQFDIQFLPESGRYIPGDLAVIAFKAVDGEGRGQKITGVVYDRHDSIVVSFSDTYKGMGKFTFLPSPNEAYYAVIRDEYGTVFRKALPALSEHGAVIHIASRKEKRYIAAMVTELLLPKSLFLVLSNGGEVFLCSPIVGKEHNVVVEETRMYHGINHATIVDREGNVYAQRIFFVYPQQMIEVDIIADKMEPKQREKVTYTIQLSDTFQQGIQGAFSLSVTDQYLIPHDPSDNLLSYMLLSSELQGTIENPAAYFNPDQPEMKEAMDLLMLTQGWRYYDMPAIFANTSKEPLIKKEYAQTISGKATGIFNRVRRSNIVLYAPELELSLFHELDKSGRFEIRGLNFPDSTRFVLSCSGQRSGSSGYYLETDNQFFPAISLHHYFNKKGGLSKKQSNDVINEFGLFLKGEKVTLLEAAIVTATPVFIKPAFNPSPFNQLFEARQIRERKQLAPFDGVPLIDYIVTTWPSVRNAGVSVRNSTSFLLSGWSETPISFENVNVPVLYIDQIKKDNLSELEHLSVGHVENIVVLKSVEAGALFNSISPVILISLRRSFPKGNSEAINTRLITPLGWQKPSAFYSPNYSLKVDNDAIRYDNRTTLYWNPFVVTDEHGVAEISFYTSDRKTLYRFSIEGITNDGRYISICR